MTQRSAPELDPIPEEYGSLVIQLVTSPATKAIDFYAAAFGAHEFYRQHDESGQKIAYCELLIGRSRMMLHDEYPERDLHSASSLGGSPVTLVLYVDDTDAAVERALAAGAELVSPPEDRFWGVRSAVLIDPFGHRWLIGSRIEDLSPEDILGRARSEPKNARLPLGGRDKRSGRAPKTAR